jgi:hypothetical protein
MVIGPWARAAKLYAYDISHPTKFSAKMKVKIIFI